jgi:hypothetical protein
MTPAAHAHERDERPEDPLNRMLDVFEVMVESLKHNGLEAPLRARVARLLPPEEVGALPLSQVLTALRDADKCRLSEEAKQRNQTARKVVMTMMGAAP